MPVTTFKRTRTSKTGKKIVETVRRKGAATSANVKPPKKITKVEVGPYVKGKHAYHLAPKK
jgi:hypothetical protein